LLVSLPVFGFYWQAFPQEQAEKSPEQTQGYPVKSDPDIGTRNGSGYVGIGTTNPLSKLHVVGDSSYNYLSSDNYSFYGQFNNSGNWGAIGTPVFGVDGYAASGYALRGTTVDGSALYVTATGNGFAGRFYGRSFFSDNVGIGVFNAAYKLHVDGTVSATSYLGDGSALTGTKDNLGNHIATENIHLSGNWLSGDGGNEGVFISSSGKVGIGTSTTPEILNIKTSGATFVTVERNLDQLGGYVHRETGESESVWYFPFFRGWQGDNLIIRDEDALKDVMTFQNNTGHVGIGTSTPSVNLNVDGGSDISPAGGGYFLVGDTASKNIGFDDNEIMARNGGVGSPLFINREGGNVIISETAGNVGIGTNSPSQKLHVDGNLFVDGDITFENDTSYLTIAPGAFIPQQESYNYQNNGYRLFNQAASSAYFQAEVCLPHGAEIINFTTYWIDYSSSYNGELIMRRMSLDDGSFQTIADVVTLANSGSWLVKSASSFVGPTTVDNGNYLYYLSLFLEQSTAVEFYGVRITYITSGI
jgi:hypothetical protein